MAAAGPKRRELPTEAPANVPDGFANPRVVLPGILAVEHRGSTAWSMLTTFPLVTIVDDSDFCAAT